MTKDMTHGKITPQLIKFTIPLVLGNLFQLLYNVVDSIIVGKFVGEEALAAVGTSNPLVTLALLFISGMCMGAGVLMGMHYGAKEYDTLERQISSTMIGGLIFSITLSLLCIFLSPYMLRTIQTQEVIIPMATQYLRIIFSGIVFTFIYNFFASTLRALGDSQSPLYFLIFSSILNVVGDLFFVIVLNWGSNGCAISTVLSEFVCCILCWIYIKRKVPILNLKRRWFIFDAALFKKTVAFSSTSALQQATVQLGKVGIQTIVNTMGVPVMAAFAAINRIDDFAYIPEQNIANAMTSFLAQNKGAKKKDRIKDGFLCGLRIELFYGIFIFLVCFIFAKPLMRLFVNDQYVVELGVTYLRVIAIIYILPAITNGIQGFFRGIGDLKVTLVSSFINMFIRVLAAIPLVYYMNLGIVALPISYLIGWAAMLLTELPLLFKQWRKLNNIDKTHITDKM